MTSSPYSFVRVVVVTVPLVDVDPVDDDDRLVVVQMAQEFDVALGALPDVVFVPCGLVEAVEPGSVVEPGDCSRVMPPTASGAALDPSAAAPAPDADALVSSPPVCVSPDSTAAVPAAATHASTHATTVSRPAHPVCSPTDRYSLGVR